MYINNKIYFQKFGKHPSTKVVFIFILFKEISESSSQWHQVRLLVSICFNQTPK